LLSSVKSRLDNTWLTKTDGAAASGVGKLAAHAREWCFPIPSLPAKIAVAARAAIAAARGRSPEAVFDSTAPAADLTQCFQTSGLFKTHRRMASRGLLEVALAATAYDAEQPTLHSVFASSEWRGGCAVTVVAYAQPCRFPAYALKFASKLRCISFPRIEPFVGIIVNNEVDCLPEASISVSEGVSLSDYLFKERHALSFRDMIDLAVDIASAVACVVPAKPATRCYVLMLSQVCAQQRAECRSPQLQHLQRGRIFSVQLVPCRQHARTVLCRGRKHCC
jgi:hypothetical protein